MSFVEDPDDLESWRAAVQPNTKAFFAETISNPKQDVLDIEGVAGVAHEVGVPLIVDNTVATPYLLRPFEWGADIVVHSTTKYLGGHGTSIGGVIIDSGKFDYAAEPERFPGFNQPDPSYHGLVFARDLGVGSALGANLAFILKARVQLLRDLGPAASPFNAFLLVAGPGDAEPADRAARRQRRRGSRSGSRAGTRSSRSRYAGLASSPWHAQAAEVPAAGRRRRAGLRDQGRPRGGQAVRRGACELHSHVANIGDVRSLVIHPASTTHSQLSEEEQLATGVTPGPGPAGGRDRAHRRHPGRPRAGLRRRQERLMSEVERVVATGAWRPGDDPGRRQFAAVGPLDLETGGRLPEVEVAYETWGTLNPAR